MADQQAREPGLRVDVAVPVPVHRTFTYSWPASAPEPCPGQRVRVPFGRRQLVGVVIRATAAATEPATGLRPISEVIDARPLITPGLLELAAFVSEYYVAPLGETLRCLWPSGIGRAGAVVGGRPLERVAVLADAAGDPRATESILRRAPAQARAVEVLRQHGGRLRTVELAALGVPARIVRELVRREVVRIDAVPWAPDDLSTLGLVDRSPPVRLTDEQTAAVDAAGRAVRGRQPEQLLLFGVTGSGKTEVYLQAARAALEVGRGVLILVPEIGLTPALVGRLTRRFGDGLAVLHSRLSRTERIAHWHRIRSGEAPIVVGARSAVFAPLPDPGLIVVDEEQDTSYKQEETPRYHARDMALVRGKAASCPVMLVSATPSMETYARAENGKVDRLVLPRRVSGRQLPSFQIVDLREEFRARREQSLLGNALVSALAESVGAGGQAMLLLNRRGWASFVLCRACGEPLICGPCSVSMTWHRTQERLVCHYCGRRRARPVACPQCSEEALQEMGSGTERIEDELARLLPDLRVARMDADTVRGRTDHVQMLRRFADGEADVLLGTQMIAKGHDFPGVTLVGILGGDAVLSLPDFRAAEWTFHLITQMAGRAGRGHDPGRVIMQAFRADHYALARAREHDFEGFFRQESEFRRALLYPPFAVLAAIRARHRQAERAAELIDRAATLLRDDSEAAAGIRLLGPAPAPLARLRGDYRFHLMLKARSRSRLTSVLTRLRRRLERENIRPGALVIDVDPISLL